MLIPQARLIRQDHKRNCKVVIYGLDIEKYDFEDEDTAILFLVGKDLVLHKVLPDGYWFKKEIQN